MKEGKEVKRMNSEHPSYISAPYKSIGGWKVCLMVWVQDEVGEYYDVWNTSPGFKTSDKAAQYGKEWAEAEDINYACNIFKGGERKRAQVVDAHAPPVVADMTGRKGSTVK